ncbi:MAG: diguanylate cyclase [Actinomycetota bacterium]|nr:diguanylate cyclase [Actinomycetota bacterium]
MEENNKIKDRLLLELEKLRNIIDEYEVEKPKPDMKKAEKTLKESRDKYDILINTAPFGIITIDEKGIITSCNDKILNFLGQSREEVIGKHFTEQKFLNEEDIPRYLQIFSFAISGHEGKPFEISGEDKNGNDFFGEVYYGLIKKDGKVKYIQVLINDITRRKKAEERLRYIRFHDNLTGLHNRGYFEGEIERLDVDRQLPLSFIVGDVNGLKIINDNFGNKEGDKVLKTVAGILKEYCRKEDIISRWGEDEFSILLPKTTAEEAGKILKRIKEACKNQKNTEASFDFAIGKSTKEKPEQDIQDIVREAKDEMYKNKLFEFKSIPDSVISSLVDSLLQTSFETREHGKRVRKMVLKVGKSLGLSKSKLDELSVLADLHDLGKIAIPDDIATKKDELSKRDWQVLRSYPEIGYNIALSSKKFSNIAEYILTHHERWDGKGYPQGLRGEDIPLLSRITAIADAYDVMRSGRFYKNTVSRNEAIEELKKSSGTQFDPKLVRQFIKIIKED